MSRNLSEYRDHLDTALQARKAGRRNVALEHFREAQNSTQSSEELRQVAIFICEELRVLGQTDHALKSIAEVLVINSECPRALMVKGSILHAQSDSSGAEEVFRGVLGLRPKHLNARLALVRSLIARSDLTSADELLVESLQFFPECLELHCLRSDLLLHRGKDEEAEILLKEIQALFPESPKIINRRSALQVKRGLLDEALSTLLSAVDRRIDDVSILWQIVQIYFKKGEFDRALHMLDEFVIDTKHWQYRITYQKAIIYLAQARYQEAELEFRKAIQVASNPDDALQGLATILVLTGRNDESLKILKEGRGEMLRSRPAAINSYLRSHPQLLEKLKSSDQLAGSKRLRKIAGILIQDPRYFGSALWLARELRDQDIFQEIRTNLNKRPLVCRNSVPHHIVQYWPDPILPDKLMRKCNSWAERHPTYSYQRYSYHTAIDFLEDHFGHIVVQAFESCALPAMQTDLFRLAYLSKLGGVFIDIHKFCGSNLQSILDKQPELVAHQGNYCAFEDTLLACAPGQSMIKYALTNAIHNFCQYNRENRWFKTGPAVLTTSICSMLAPYVGVRDIRLWPRLYVLDNSECRKYIW